MPYNGSGTFTRTQNWTADALAGIKIVTDRHDNEDDNFASGLSQVITRDGQSPPTANLPMGGFKHTNAANPTNPQDYATKAYADAIRTFTTGITLTGASTGIAPNQVSTAWLGYTEADMSIVGRNAGSPAASVKRIAFNDAANGLGADVLWINEDGGVMTPGSTQPRGTIVESILTAGTWTKKAGLKYIELEGVGPGGAGGGAAVTSATQMSAGAGGGAGAYNRCIIPASALGATEAVTLGAAGVGVAAGTGGNGSTSSFGAHASWGGGLGGLIVTGTSQQSILGALGGNSAGPFFGIQSQGATGGAAQLFYSANFPLKGQGADSPYGGGGRGDQLGNAVGENGMGYGSGASGACHSISQTPNYAGGNGAPTFIRMKEYY